MSGGYYPLDFDARDEFAATRDDSPAAYWGLRLALICLAVWGVGFVAGFQVAAKCLTFLGLAAAMFGVARPSLGLIGISLLCTLDSISRVFVLSGGLLRWNTVNYWLLIVIALGAFLILTHHDLPTRLLEAFIAVLLLQLLFSPDLRAGVQHILGAVSFFGLLVYFLRAADDPSVWYWMAVVDGVAAALGGALYYLRQAQLPYINANAWAFLPLTALFAACLARHTPALGGRRQLLLWGLVVVNLVWVFLSGSRGGMTIAGCCLLYLLSGVPGVSRRLVLMVGGVLLGSLLAGQFAEREEFVRHRLDKSMDEEYSLSSRTSGRSDLAIGGWRMFLKEPLFGVGTGAFAETWADFHDRQGMGDYARGRESEAHSGWIKTLAEAGLSGILLHVAFVVSFTIVGLRSGSSTLFQLGLLVTLTLAIAFISTEFQGKGIWFFSAGAAVVLQREARLRREQRWLQERIEQPWRETYA